MSRRLWEWYREGLNDLRIRAAFVQCASDRCSHRDAGPGPGRLISPMEGPVTRNRRRVAVCPCREETCYLDAADAAAGGGSGGKPTRRAAGCGRRAHEPLSCHAKHVLDRSVRAVADAAGERPAAELAAAAAAREEAARAAEEQRMLEYREAELARAVGRGRLGDEDAARWGWIGWHVYMQRALTRLWEDGLRRIAAACADGAGGPGREGWFGDLLRELAGRFRKQAVDRGLGLDAGKRVEAAAQEDAAAAEGEAAAAAAAISAEAWLSGEAVLGLLGRCGLDDARAAVEAALAAGGEGAEHMDETAAAVATARLVAQVPVHSELTQLTQVWLQLATHSFRVRFLFQVSSIANLCIASAANVC